MTPEQALRTYATKRDAEAFRQLVEEYQVLVYSAASRLLKTREDVEDVTQQTFLKLAQRAGTIRENVAAWLYATAVNGALDYIRRDSARRRHEDRLLLEKHDASPVEWHELSTVIDEEIARLPHDARDLIVAHFLQGESHRSIADRLGVNQSTISRRMEPPVEMLRKALANRGYGGATMGVGAMLIRLPKTSVPRQTTAELMKVGIVGASGKAAGGLLVVAFLATIASITAGVVVWRMSNPRSPAPPIVAASAPAPAPAPADVKTASTDLAKTYSLASTEEIRRIPAPFPPAREAFLRAEMSRFGGNVDRILHANCIFYFNNDSLMMGGSSGAAMSMDQFVKNALRVQWFHRDDFELLDWQPGSADWVIRGTISEDENIEKRLHAWAKMLSADTSKQVSFESYKTTRPCIVMKGKHRLPDYQDRNGMHPIVLSVATLSPEEMLLWKKRGEQLKTDYRFDFQDAAQFLDAPFFGGYVGEIFYILPDAHLDHTQPTFKEDLQKVLTNLQNQVGCDWTIQDREIQVWRPIIK